jgi:transposase
MIDSHFQKLFSLGLGIDKPWYIKSIDLVPSEKAPQSMEMHIEVDFAEGATFSLDGREGSYGVYDTRERIWRHLNFFQYRCYVKARVPRVTDGQGKVRTVSVPWGRSGSGFTLLMEGVILSLVKHMPVRAVAQEIGEHDTRLWRVVEHHVRTALDGQDFSDVRAIGCDEYSHKGHNYITVFLSHPDVKLDEEGRRSQVGRGRVLFVTEGKDKAAVGRFLKRFEQKDGEPEDVTVATSDMIHGFRSAMTEAFPNAVMTVDKFHVVMNCSKAVDDTRRREMHSREKGKTTALKKSRYLWLKNGDKLTPHQRKQLDELLGIDYLETAKAYDCRLRLQDFYESHTAYDECLLYDFEHLALDFCNSSVWEIRKFGKTLTRNAGEILNYFLTFRTNAILEGFNSKISIIKNRARGFRNMTNFITMIYFVCGELDLPFVSVM